MKSARSSAFSAFSAVTFFLLASLAHAVEPSEQLKDPAQEARAREISRQLRCVVCQNESIDSSNADIARDLRLAVRTRIQAGDSDEQVIAWVRQRYGDFVLLQPPLNRSTWPLWFGPPALLVIAAALIARQARKRREIVEPAPLTDDERRRLEELQRE